MNKQLVVSLLSLGVAFGAACGEARDVGHGGDGGDALDQGVGSECSRHSDCNEDQTCLGFKGGYCGAVGCMLDVDCPSGSACVSLIDGNNYCFLICDDKEDCNVNRPADAEANCVSSIIFTDPDTSASKACEPPFG